MADRTSAGLFGDIFEYLAENPDDRAKAFALKLWRLTHEYDFSPCQMECDEALAKLELYRAGQDDNDENQYGSAPEGS